MCGFYHHTIRCVNNYTHACLTGLVFFALLSTKTWLSGAWNSLPDPDSFPSALRSAYSDLAERFGCDFNQVHACEFSLGRGWSFHQSFQEFALKVQQAAAAVAETRTTLHGTNESDDLPPPLPDHFLCSVASPSTAQREYAPLQVQIPWPRFVPFAIPLTVSNNTKQTLLTNTSVAAPRRLVGSGEIISHTVDVPESTPVACMQLSLRFPPQRAVQVNLSFDSAVQLVMLESVTHRPLNRSRSRRAYSPILPRNVWLNLSVPLFTYQASKRELHSSQPENGSILFSSQGLTWMAVPRQTTVSIRASSEVCVDNFRLRPIIVEPDKSSSPAPCFRGVSWWDPVTKEQKTVLLDSSGYATKDQNHNGFEKLNERQRRQHLLTENSTFIGYPNWFRFTGAFVLAVCATVLFLLFTSTLCISIALTRRRRKSPPSHLIPASRTGYSGSHNRRFPPPDFVEDSLLPRVQKSKSEEETQSSGTDRVSTENGESLFQHDGNTGRSTVVPEDGETEIIDPMATSAMQLARNWFLYRNRGDRLRQRPNFYYPPHSPPIGEPQTPILHSSASPVPSVSSPYVLLKHPMDKMCKPSFMDNQEPRDSKPTCAPVANYRHSLVLAVDEQDQLIILPSAQSIASSMHRSTLRGAENSVTEVEEPRDDAQLTPSRQNTLPTIDQRSRLRTIDAPGQGSSASISTEENT